MKKPFVYICTLMSAPARVENVQKNIIPYLEEGRYIIWPGIDAKTDELEKFYEANKHDIGNIRLKKSDEKDSDQGWAHPRAGLALVYSGFAILKDAFEKGRESCIFFEDDSQLNPNFYEKLDLLVSELPSDADFLKFYTKFFPQTSIHIDKKIEPYATKWNGWVGSGDTFYFTQKGIKNTLEYMKNTTDVWDVIMFRGNESGAMKGFYTKMNDLCRHTAYYTPSMLKKNSVRLHNIPLNMPYES